MRNKLLVALAVAAALVPAACDQAPAGARLGPPPPSKPPMRPWIPSPAAVAAANRAVKEALKEAVRRTGGGDTDPSRAAWPDLSRYAHSLHSPVKTREQAALDLAVLDAEVAWAKACSGLPFREAADDRERAGQLVEWRRHLRGVEGLDPDQGDDVQRVKELEHVLGGSDTFKGEPDPEVAATMKLLPPRPKGLS